MINTEKINKYVCDLESANRQIKEIIDTSFNYNEKLKVLYLEDDKEDIDFIKEILDINYIDLDCVSNYENAILKTKDKKYDAFIVDILLNEKYSGFDFINYIQKISNKPIIVLTGTEDKRIEQECYEMNLPHIYKKNDLLDLIKYNSTFIKSLLGKNNEQK